MGYSKAVKYLCISALFVTLGGCLSLPTLGGKSGNSVVGTANKMAKALNIFKPPIPNIALPAVAAINVVPVQTRVVVAPVINSHPHTPARSQSHTPSNVAVATHSPTVNVRRGHSSTVSIDEYDEHALNNYYAALKRAVKGLSTFASMAPQQIDMINNRTGFNVWTMMWAPGFSGEIETSKIELESWPLDARKKGWSILGKRIVKYNKLFYKHRDSILENSGYDETVKKKLKNIVLVTENSIFEE